MIEKYYNDYYRGKIKLKDIFKLENTNKYYIKKELKNKGLKTYISYYNNIDFGNEELNNKLKKKYSSIVNRCNGGVSDKYNHYNGMDYMNILEWISFLNDNKNLILELWKSYIENNSEIKYSLSIDRIDNTKGYTKNNIQITTHGFNSWKRGIKPIKVSSEEKIWYFMSCEEASRYFGLHGKYFRLILNNKKESNKYRIYRVKQKCVLDYYKIDDLQSYYKLIYM